MSQENKSYSVNADDMMIVLDLVDSRTYNITLRLFAANETDLPGDMKTTKLEKSK